MKENRHLLAIIIAVSFMLFLADGWRQYETLEQEAIEKGHAVMHEGQFRWKNCKLGYMTGE